MTKIAGISVKSSVYPLSAWFFAALVTLFSLLSSPMHVGTMSDQAVSVSERALPSAQEFEEGSVLRLLARLSDVLSSRG